MSTFRIVALATISWAAVALGQSGYQSPELRTELFGGFSTVSVRPGKLNGEGLSRARLHGLTFTATSYHVFSRWGLTAEVTAGARDQDALEVSRQSYLFGGTFRAVQRRKLALTGRILAGVDRWDPKRLPPGGYPGQNSFVFGFGQAIDLKMSENLAIRVQPDLQFVRRKDSGGDTRMSLNTPLSVGLVLKFGKR